VKRQLGRFIMMALREVGCEVRKWMSLVQDRAQWRAVVSAAIEVNILVRYFWLFGYATKGSKRCLYSMEMWRGVDPWNLFPWPHGRVSIASRRQEKCINCVPQARKVHQLRPELSEGGVSVAPRCAFKVLGSRGAD
jgi:hypothetical protein